MTLTPEEKAGCLFADKKLSLAITPYYFNLIDRNDPECPIRRQVIPRGEEMHTAPEEMLDPVGEEKTMLLQRLLRPALLLSAVLPFLAPTASAGDLSLGFRLGRKSSIQVSFRSGGYRRCAPRRIWVPGCYTKVAQQVFVPGVQRKVWVPPVYGTRYDACGRPVPFLVCGGRWKIEYTSGCTTTRYVKVWTPGHWKTTY